MNETINTNTATAAPKPELPNLALQGNQPITGSADQPQTASAAPPGAPEQVAQISESAPSLPNTMDSAEGNTLIHRIHTDPSVLIPGEICLANESRFNAAFFSQPLTEYAVGWREPNNIEALLDFIAPPVQVARRFEYKKADTPKPSFRTPTTPAPSVRTSNGSSTAARV